MKFQTPVTVKPTECPIDYNSHVLLLGSCFAVNIGDKFGFYKFRNLVNPFGILFHPLAIDEVIHRCINNQQYNASDVFLNNGRWHSFAAHSDLSHPDQQIMLQTLNERLVLLREALVTATHIVISYGTAWVYREKATKNIVANCHKVPSTHFDKEILSTDTIEAAISNTISLIESVNPMAQIIFTISPVRHTKDGMVENQRSKANLIAALHDALEASEERKLAYFPAYEILMDELRDYRYYADDLIHPSKMAIEFIWQRFTESYIQRSAIQTMDEVGKVQKALSHRPFDVDSASHQQFIESVKLQIAKLETAYPHMKF